MTLKNHYNLPIKHTDQILSLNQRMLIYESIKLIDKDDYSNFLNKQKAISNITKSQSIFNAVEEKQNALNNNSLMNSQVGIIVFGENESSLHTNLKNTSNLLFNIGISTVREDYYMMGGILSAIPGNSFFFRREMPDSVYNSGLFASIKQKSIGGYNGSIWGKPIAIFKTVDDLPYFFNFHNSFNIGHTIIVGPEINKPHLLRYFLICESFKFDLKVVNFDYDGSDDEVMTTCSAKVINSYETPFSMDMFRIMNYDPKFIQKVFEYIIFKDLVISDEISAEVLNLISQIIEIINKEKTSTIDFSKLSNDVCNLIQNSDVGLNSDIKHNASEFFKSDCFFKFFCLDTPIEDKIISINFGSFLNDINFDKSVQKRMKSLSVFLFLKDLNSKLDYSNLRHTIIAFDSDVLDLCNIFYEDFMIMFEELAKKHVVFIITCEHRNTLYNSKNIKEIISKLIPTRFFLSDKFVDKPFKEIFDLNHVDLNTIKMYNPSEHMFLLKQDDQSIVASFKILNNLKITK
jgi:type IV secretory pathway VirB4 component